MPDDFTDTLAQWAASDPDPAWRYLARRMAEDAHITTKVVAISGADLIVDIQGARIPLWLGGDEPLPAVGDEVVVRIVKLNAKRRDAGCVLA